MKSYLDGKQLVLLLPDLSERLQLEVDIEGLVFVQDANLAFDNTDDVHFVAVTARALAGVDFECEGPDLDLDAELLEVEGRGVLVLASAEVLDRDLDLQPI